MGIASKEVTTGSKIQVRSDLNYIPAFYIIIYTSMLHLMKPKKLTLMAVGGLKVTVAMWWKD